MTSIMAAGVAPALQGSLFTRQSSEKITALCGMQALRVQVLEHDVFT